MKAPNEDVLARIARLERDLERMTEELRSLRIVVANDLRRPTLPFPSADDAGARHVPLESGPVPPPPPVAPLASEMRPAVSRSPSFDGRMHTSELGLDQPASRPPLPRQTPPPNVGRYGFVGEGRARRKDSA